MDFFPPADAARVADDIMRRIQGRGRNSLEAPLELEFRLGTIRSEKRFDPSINEVVYKNILKGLKSNPNWGRVEESHTVDYYTGTRRLTHDAKTDLWRAVAKTRIANYTLSSSRALDVRISLAEERDVPVPDGGPPPTPTLVRDKRRISFVHKFWRYDLTEVVSRGDQPDEDRKIIYEIELELTDPMQIEHKGRDYVIYILSYGLALCCDMIKLANV